MEVRSRQNRRPEKKSTFRRNRISNSGNVIPFKERLIDGLVILILLISFGFPGKYTLIFGASSSKILEYMAFAAQIFVMLFSSSDDGIANCKILDFKEKYAVIYLMAAVYFLDSMFVTNYPAEQIVSCARYTVTIFFALWMTDHYDAEKILHLIASAQLLFIGFTIIFMLVKPGAIFSQEQGQHDFTGFMRTKNNAASEFSICILLQVVWFRIMRKNNEIVSRRYLISLIIQVIFLFMCNAKGAVLCLIVPILYVFFGKYDGKTPRRLPLGIVYVTLSIAFLVTALTILPLFQPLFALIGKDATLTGRIPLWRQIIQVMLNRRTFTGYGYGMFWRDRQAVAQVHQAFSRNSFMGSMTTGAHNVLMELWMNVGLFGVAAYFLALIVSTMGAAQMKWTNYLFSAVYILWFMVFGWTERSMSTYEYQTLFLFIAMGLSCNKQRLIPKRRQNVK